jgi:phospholipid/cholesterol/gamma-HCH transport system ATP-binding protein
VKQGPPLLETQGVTVDGIAIPDIVLHGGTTFVILTQGKAEGHHLVDMLLGLNPPDSGHVTLLEHDMSRATDDARLSLLRDIAHVGIVGDLISNLKIWENILLPLEYHHRKPGPDDEASLMEGLAKAGLDGTWMAKTSGKLPGDLSAFEQRIISLLRTALLPCRLLICEFLFDNLTRQENQKLAAILRWMQEKTPDLGVLHVHHAPSDERNLDLTILGKPSIFHLGEEPHAIP